MVKKDQKKDSKEESTKATEKIPRFIVTEREGSAHGGPFELEIDTYFDVTDTKTNKVIQTYTGEFSASYVGGPAAWGEGGYDGVSKVEISEDEKYILVHSGSTVEKVKLPE